MAGIVNQRDIELVFEEVMSAEIEKMSEEDRDDARRFHLDEAARFSVEEDESEDEDEDEEVHRHHMEPDADGLRECIADLKYETAELAEKNSLQREMNALMKVRNTLTEEDKCLREEMLDAEEEWGRLLRDESPPTTRIRELEEETKKLRKRAESAEDFIRERRSEVAKVRERNTVCWWRRWFLWWL